MSMKPQSLHDRNGHRKWRLAESKVIDFLSSALHLLYSLIDGKCGRLAQATNINVQADMLLQGHPGFSSF